MRAANRIAIGALAGLMVCGSAFAQSPTPEERLKQAGITLRTPGPPPANRANAVRTGNLLFVSGHTSQFATKGKVGAQLTVEQGRQAARQSGINLLSTVRASLGSLDKVKRVVKVLGMVNAPEGFTDPPKVIDGFSDLMVEIFGDAGKSARSAVGVQALPGNDPVEVEAILEVE